MQKFLLFLTLITVSSSINAGTCSDGTILKDNNGNEFCKSNSGMEWWRAFSWCESQGRHLASFQSMCPREEISSQNDLSICPNLQGVGNGDLVWSSFGYGSNLALYVDLASGAIQKSDYNDQTIHALCR